MVDQGSKKKRKAATEQVPPKQPIEALQRYKELHASWPEDVKALLSEELPQERRHELWEVVTEQASQFVDQFAWAVPDDRALRILEHFSPIIEIGAGAGYWAHCMHSRGIECCAYDMYPAMTLEGQPRAVWAEVSTGGSEKLMEQVNANKTLLLCYPDDFEKQEGLSLAAQCLQALQGDTVVHIGELFGDTASLDHAPWGRTTGAEAQQHLFSLFRHQGEDEGQQHDREHSTTATQKNTEAAKLKGSGSGASNKKQQTASLGRGKNTEQVARSFKASAGEGKGEHDEEEVCGGEGEDGKDKEEEQEEEEEGEGVDGSSGDEEGEGGDEEEEDVMEFICDSRKFSLGSEGWALEVFRHLL